MFGPGFNRSGLPLDSGTFFTEIFLRNFRSLKSDHFSIRILDSRTRFLTQETFPNFNFLIAFMCICGQVRILMDNIVGTLFTLLQWARH